MELDYFLMFISGKQLFFLAWEMLFAFRARAHTHTRYQNAVRKKNQILYTIFLKGDTQKGGPGSKPCVYSQNRPAPLYRILAMLLLTE